MQGIRLMRHARGNPETRYVEAYTPRLTPLLYPFRAFARENETALGWMWGSGRPIVGARSLPLEDERPSGGEAQMLEHVRLSPEVAALAEELVATRRDLHAHPELGYTVKLKT